MKLHTKGLLSWASIAKLIISGFQPKVSRHIERQENTQSKESKQVSESNLDRTRF